MNHLDIPNRFSHFKYDLSNHIRNYSHPILNLLPVDISMDWGLSTQFRNLNLYDEYIGSSFRSSDG